MDEFGWTLVAVSAALAVCNVWLCQSHRQTVRDQARDHLKVSKALREDAERTRLMFSDELVSTRIAQDGLQNLTVSAYNRVMADVVAVQQALDLSEDEAKEYLRSSVVKPKDS